MAGCLFDVQSPLDQVLGQKPEEAHTQPEKEHKGAKPAGYYVLMRPTHESNWEKKFYVTDTKATLPYSKDNYFFAVQSVDAEGHASLPVLPVPVR